jgi:transposase
MRMREARGPIYTNPAERSTGEAPAQRALMTMKPCAEGFSDAPAAAALRARMDWKCARALDLTDPGFEASVLRAFRQRLIPGTAQRLRFETRLTQFREPRLINAKGRQRTDSTPVLAAIPTLQRLEGGGETLRPARILLQADVSEDSRRWTDAEIAEALDMSASTVHRVRQAFVEQGIEAALSRKCPTGRQYRTLDGAQEAQLIAVACSAPPTGRARWTLKLLADKLVALDIVDTISAECVRTTLKKTRSNHGSSSTG